MFAETHKIISANIVDRVKDSSNILLDKSSLSWGSVAPDILPKYKFHRHYQMESIDYIVDELVKLIYLGKNIDFSRKVDPITMGIFSERLGIASHYLSDFVCLPHAERWTFPKNMIKHLNYEAKLDKISPKHSFRADLIEIDGIDIYVDENVDLRLLVKNYIEDVVEEYSVRTGYENDLDFALSLNLSLTQFILEISRSYNEAVYQGLVFEF